MVRHSAVAEVKLNDFQPPPLVYGTSTFSLQIIPAASENIPVGLRSRVGTPVECSSSVEQLRH